MHIHKHIHIQIHMDLPIRLHLHIHQLTPTSTLYKSPWQLYLAPPKTGPFTEA
jgi:hypothetical protein